MVSREDVLRELPEVEQIGDPALRERVLDAYVAAMQEGGWKSLEDVPFTLLVPTERSYASHVRRVTQLAASAGRVMGDVNMDILLAGALLHDIGKLLEYDSSRPREKSALGRLVRHPVSGVGIAMRAGLPDEVLHIIACHSKEGDLMERTPEAIIVHHCDFIDFEIERRRLK